MSCKHEGWCGDYVPDDNPDSLISDDKQDETEYLLSSENNKKVLLEGIKTPPSECSNLSSDDQQVFVEQKPFDVQLALTITRFLDSVCEDVRHDIGIQVVNNFDLKPKGEIKW